VPLNEGPDSLAAEGPVDRVLRVLETALHANKSEWMFLRELRAGTGRGQHSMQRLDAFALNCYPHRGMKRVCYEIKMSRGDFRTEVKQPLKRRIGMRFSNEFYFVTPAGMLDVHEVPADSGLIEVGRAASIEEWKPILKRHAGFFHYDPATGDYCVLIVPAPWRETPGPTWELVAAMMRNQRRELEEAPPPAPAQQKFGFEK
jgi:hypothetical protein